MSLKSRNRHQWVIRWLSEHYQQLMTNRTSQEILDRIFTTYCRVLTWMDLPLPQVPPPHDDRAWRAFISDAIQFHRLQTGINPKDHDLLQNVNTGDRATATSLPRFNYHIALDGLRSLFNVGSIFRTCDAAGFQSVILGNTPGRDNPTIMKTSMGSAAWISQTMTIDLGGTLLEMKDMGYPVIGIETIRESTPYQEYSWPDQGIVVMGNEEYGLSPHVLGVCDTVVCIPMFGRKNSINVAAAASVIAFHVASILNKSRMLDNDPDPDKTLDPVSPDKRIPVPGHGGQPGGDCLSMPAVSPREPDRCNLTKPRSLERDAPDHD